MKIKEFAWDFHLFDGEGGGDAGESAASSSESKQDTKTIVYGKSIGEDQTPRQVGSDNSGEANDLNAEWEALTGKNGKFHELLGQRVSDAIQNRFKNQANLQAQVDGITNDLSPLFMNYGLKSGDFEGLKNAIANDDAFFKAGAERAGLDVEQYKQNLKLQADAERGRQITEAYKAQQMFDKWEADAVELQKIFPGFDLGLEIKNFPEFAELLNKGVPVREAFTIVHLDEIMNNANAYHQRTATQQVVSAIQQRAARPMEGALNNVPAVEHRSDPSKLTNDDFDRIDEIVAAGGSVTF